METDHFCSWYLGIRESDSTMVEHNLCYSDQKDVEIFTSSGDKVEVFVTGVSDLDSLPPFLIEYKRKLLKYQL